MMCKSYHDSHSFHFNISWDILDIVTWSLAMLYRGQIWCLDLREKIMLFTILFRQWRRIPESGRGTQHKCKPKLIVGQFCRQHQDHNFKVRRNCKVWSSNEVNEFVMKILVFRDPLCDSTSTIFWHTLCHSSDDINKKSLFKIISPFWCSLSQTLLPYPPDKQSVSEGKIVFSDWMCDVINKIAKHRFQLVENQL